MIDWASKGSLGRLMPGQAKRDQIEWREALPLDSAPTDRESIPTPCSRLWVPTVKKWQLAVPTAGKQVYLAPPYFLDEPERLWVELPIPG